MTCEKNNFGLCEICLGINSIDSYKCVMENIAKKIVEELDFIDASMIRMSDRTCKKLEIASYCGLSDNYIHKGDILLSESEVGRRVFINGETVVLNLSDENDRKSVQYFDFVEKEKITSIITAPMKTTTYCMGILRGYSRTLNSFTPEQIELFSKYASQAAIAVETFRSMKRMKTLVEFSQKVNSSLNLQEILDTAVQYAAEGLNLKGASIRIYENRTGQMELMASYGLSEMFLSTGLHNLTYMPIDQEIMQGNPLYIQDVGKDERFKHQDMAKKEKVVSLYGLPLASSERVFGVLRVYSTSTYVFSEDEINYLKVLANQTSIAIQNAHQIERLHRLSLVTNAMNKSLSKDEVFKQIVSGLYEATASVGSALFIWQQSFSRFTLKAFYGNVSEESLQALQQKYDDDSEHELYDKNITISDISVNELKQLGIKSSIRIPIILKDHVIGLILCFTSERHDNHISESENEFFKALSNAAATAISNMKQYEKVNKKYMDMVDDVFVWYDGYSRGLE